jgi:multisubunit Na+/H+ antiporter MnhC subunit
MKTMILYLVSILIACGVMLAYRRDQREWIFGAVMYGCGLVIGLLLKLTRKALP